MNNDDEEIERLSSNRMVVTSSPSFNFIPPLFLIILLLDRFVVTSDAWMNMFSDVISLCYVIIIYLGLIP